MEPALDVALSCLRNPSLLETTKERPLPNGMLPLLRLAAGDEALAAELAETRHRSPREILDAAIFFVHQVLFDPGADSYRTLGVRPDAGDAQIKEHYRWLVRWQHPDRAKDVWDGVYADRVNLAWQDLRTPERRRAYDARVAAAVAEPSPVPLQRVPIRTWHPVDDAPPPVAIRWTRYLPGIVLGSLALLGVGLLAAIWGARPRGLPAERPSAVATLDADDRSARVAAAAAATAVDAAPAPVPPTDAAEFEELTAPAGTSSIAAPPAGASVDSQPTVPNAPFGPSPRPLDPPVPEALPRPPPAPLADLNPAAAPTARVASRQEAVPVPQAGPGRMEPEPQIAAMRAPAASLASAAPPEALGASASAASAPPSAPAPPIDRLAAEGMLGRLSRAYVAGDLPALMTLFSADARNNRGGVDVIAEDYRKLFAESSRRELTLEPSGWMERGDEATLLARYRARVKDDGEFWGDRSDGWIRFELRREDGELKISRMLHERDS